MLIDVDDLAGPGDIAKEHGFNVSVFAFWVKNPTFPQPVKVLSNGKVFSRSAVNAWIAETDRKPREPRRRYVPRRAPGTRHWVVWDHQAAIAISGPYTLRRFARTAADKFEYGIT